MKLTKTKKAEVIQSLMNHQQIRRNIIKQVNRQKSACAAFVAGQTGYNSWQDEKERRKNLDRAKAILKIMESNILPEKKEEQIDTILGVESTITAEQILEMTEGFTLVSRNSLEPYIELREVTEKHMIDDVQKLPICEWWCKEKGRSFLGLAILVGEIGDLSNYENPAKVWKRMGLAVMDGIRQGGLSKGSPAEDWIKHGYNKRRRSALWTISDCLLKTNGKDGQYKKLYDERKVMEHKRLKKQWIKEGNKENKYKPMHAHRRAQRFMEKRLLRDLWNAWNNKKIA